MSTFHGLEMAKQALFTQQSALYTTGHNIANSNTEGYSRQRVNFESDVAFPQGARNRAGIPGQIGTGVKAGTVERIRNEFLDIQFRGENSLNGYWEKRATSLGRMESVMNELNGTGLSATMDQFWNALQDLAIHPTNQGARAVVKERGIAFSDALNYYNQSLSQMRTDLKKEMDVTVQNINTIVKQIDNMNTQIKSLEVHGYLTNDLYDRRDHLIDELSKIIDIEVKYDESGQGAKSMAQGIATITTNDGVKLVDGLSSEVNEVSIVPSIDYSDFNYVDSIHIGGEEIGMPPKQQGTLHSLIKAYGYRGSEDGSARGDFIEMQESLKKMTKVFTDEFNEVHKSGTHVNEGNEQRYDFFIIDENGTVQINGKIIDDPGLIAASGNETLGDGSNAFALAAVFDKVLSFGAEGEEKSATIRDYYSSVIGSLAVQVEEAEQMGKNTGILLLQVENRRQSVSSVSLDEEMMSLIKFQHAYNAAARSMTTTDELLDRIINNMGLVGR